VHATDVDFIWVKEQNDSHNHHYHVVVFLNNDTYPNLGNFNNHRGNLSSRISQAWASALKVDYIDVVRLGLVHFCKNGCYWLDKNSASYNTNKSELFFRISYLAKLHTKYYGDHQNSFGCSRIKR
jgi:plasmid rolling circle replication initiator protein Rep